MPRRKTYQFLRKFSFLIVLLALAFFGTLAWWFTNISPVDSFDKSQQAFTVRNGAGIKEIASDLKDKGLIKNTVAFYLLVKQKNLDNKIQAGDFILSPSQSAEEIARALQKGDYDVRVTIPEGKRAQEIADILSSVHPKYQESWRAALEANEGYLFPDTYALAKEADITSIIQTMRNNFEAKYANLPSGRRTVSKEELVTIAAMIEREAQRAEDRPLVASVIFNRLDIGMALQIDATVQYALGYSQAEQKWWKKNLTLADLNINSAYNTYQNPGLPPGPISNPGFEVMKAVLEAPETDYLYYISDSTGQNHYAKTLAEHNANIKKYGL